MEKLEFQGSFHREGKGTPERPVCGQEKELIQLSLIFENQTEHLMERSDVFYKELTYPLDVRSATIAVFMRVFFPERVDGEFE